MQHVCADALPAVHGLVTGNSPGGGAAPHGSQQHTCKHVMRINTARSTMNALWHCCACMDFLSNNAMLRASTLLFKPCLQHTTTISNQHKQHIVIVTGSVQTRGTGRGPYSHQLFAISKASGFIPAYLRIPANVRMLTTLHKGGSQHAAHINALQAIMKAIAGLLAPQVPAHAKHIQSTAPPARTHNQ